jgi:NAD(P)-dependent dehydrogenase (short-subunit alcohol dehydrogenase family)
MGKDRGVVMVTGASSGIGGACAQYLSEKGYLVFGTGRRFQDYLRSSGWFYTLKMDVTNGESVAKAVQAIRQKTGRIDVLVNNAGSGIMGAIEDTSMEEAKNQMAVNFFGAFSVIKEVLPIMREQNSGYIINISSLASLYPLPFQCFYSASKSALDALTEVLRMELKSTGSDIKVVSIRPNDYNTKFTDNRRKVGLWQNSIYQHKAEKALWTSESGERNGPNPIEIAHLVEKIVNKKSPRIFYPTGSNAKILDFLRKFFPSGIRQKLLMKYCSI